MALLLASPVSAAQMSLTVAQQSVAEGDTFVVEWQLATDEWPINVVDATLYYSPDTLALEDIITGSSALVLWTEGPKLVEPGTIRLVGGIPAGVRGREIPVVKTVFRALKSGSASIALGKDARAVRSDGIATTEPITMEPLVFPIVPQKPDIIDSPTHPREDIWYRITRAVFRIREKNPVVYSLSANPDITPGGEAVRVTESIVYEGLTDGIYYFKVAAPVGDALQELQARRVLIDTTAPVVSDVQIERASELFGGKSSLSFYVLDKTSGIKRVEVKTGWFGWYRTATSPQQLRKPLFGNVVTLRVTDKAGNKTLSTHYFRGYLANWVSYCVTLGVLLWIVFIIIRMRRRIVATTTRIVRLLLQRFHSSS